MIRSAFFLLLCVLASTVRAQDFPNRPIRIIVAFAAGGATDAFARPLARRFSELIGQSVIVENRAGGNSIIGTDLVAKAVPDGYTLLVNPASQVLIPNYNKTMPYDAVRDFTPIVAAGVNRRAVVVHPSVPAQTMQELIEFGRRNPGRLSYGVAAAGSVQELAGDLLRAKAGMDMVAVAYKGGGPALNDLLGGQIPMAILVLADVIQHVRAGRLRALGIVEDRRAKALPEVPTIAESGVPGYTIPDQWVGVMGPAGLPAAIVSRLNSEFNRALASPETRAALEHIGYEVMGGTAEAFAGRMAADAALYRRIAQDIGVVPK